jgi:hypothetical protein
VLAQKAYARGDTARANQLMAHKNELEKEGMAQVAHQALIDPANVKKIEEVSNQYGVRRLVPGSLKYEGNGMYSGIGIQENGQQTPFEHFNMLHAAMSLGVIKPPEVIRTKTDENVYMRNPSTGKLDQVQEGNKFKGHGASRYGPGFIVNEKDGTVQKIEPDGSSTTLTPAQTGGVRQIMTLVGREATNRTTMDKDGMWKPDYVKRPYDQASVTSLAQNLFLNNPELGKNAPLAVKIATDINDKAKDAEMRPAMKNGELWNVVLYGTGKNRQLYGISKVPQQPTAQAAPAAPAQQTEPATPTVSAPAPARAMPVSTQAPAAAPAPAPQSLPRPTRAKSPEETAGEEADTLRSQISEANSRLHDISATVLKRDPGAADRVRAEIAKLQAAHKAAMERYSSIVGTQAAVAGRTMRP